MNRGSKPSIYSDQASSLPCLVLLLDDNQAGLWKESSLELVRDVKGHLPGVFVTRATRQSTPSLRDALSSIRFMGARSAVVVDVRSVPTGWSEDATAFNPQLSIPVITVTAAKDAGSIVGAYSLAAALESFPDASVACA
jgi:hypothetical protein